MGITPESLWYLDKHVDCVGGYRCIKMLELGCQQMYRHTEIEEASPAKEWFNLQGVDHTSIDINGLLGSISHDLSKPIDVPEWVGLFDVITDFGTSEHVSNLYQCRKTCHDFCRIGGIIIHSNPKKDNWPGHGFHFFTKDFYTALAKTGLYTLIDVNENVACDNDIDGWQINAVLKKEKSEFISEDEFNGLGGVYNK